MCVCVSHFKLFKFFLLKFKIFFSFLFTKELFPDDLATIHVRAHTHPLLAVTEPVNFFLFQTRWVFFLKKFNKIFNKTLLVILISDSFLVIKKQTKYSIFGLSNIHHHIILNSGRFHSLGKNKLWKFNTSCFWNQSIRSPRDSKMYQLLFPISLSLNKLCCKTNWNYYYKTNSNFLIQSVKTIGFFKKPFFFITSNNPM